MNNGFLTVAQTALRVKVTRQAIHQMIHDGRLSAIWMLERWAIPEAEVSRFIKERSKQRQAA